MWSAEFDGLKLGNVFFLQSATDAAVTRIRVLSW